MARPSRTGGKTSAAKTRKGRKTAKTKRSARPTTTRLKRSPVSASGKELKEAREQQAATAEILKVIASSPSNVQPVFEAIVANAARLIGGLSAGVYRFVEDFIHLEALNPAGDEALRATFPRPIGDSGDHFRRAKAGEVVEVTDTEDQPRSRLKEVARARGFRSIVYVPLKSSGISIGVIAVSRQTVGSFPAHHIELLQTFADQAVIAIGNARLFNETKEALEQQTATSEVLEVISSSPGDLQPVFDAMLENATRICAANCGILYRCSGDALRTVATYGVPQSFVEERQRNPIVSPDPETTLGRALSTKQPVQIADILAEIKDLDDRAAKLPKLAGARTVLAVPMVKGNELLGAILIYRQEVCLFTDKQVELVENFAAQAAIAIENTRLLNELRESLQQQTATADVLKVISRSAFDLGSVMNTLTHSAAELCKAEIGALYLREGDVLIARGVADADPAQADFLRRTPLQNDSSTYVGRTILAGSIRNIADAANESEIGLLKTFSEVLGFRSILFVPLMREGRGIGVFALARKRTGQFSQREVDLVQTFADQAVIAIENVRLFEEVQARTRDLQESLQQQTATADVLKVISRSTFNLQKVLDTLTESVCHLCDAYDAVILLCEGDYLRIAAHYGEIPVVDKWPLSRDWISGRCVVDRKPIYVHDLWAEEVEFPKAHAFARQTGHRTLFAVPLLRDQEVIGAINIRRTEVRPFTDKQIELVSTFADQAVIAIRNVRLFEEVQQRTRELSKSLDDLRTAQDRLVQTEKLASLGQLTAGIAHEIKNPLNFVNNFSALSVELTDELKDVLKQSELAEKSRQEVGELTQMLRSNLEKVVQHGKRADSIVKNMLLHSREGSGEHRPVEINAIIDESLNLAYHGARAEGRDFKISLERDFDPAVGVADIYPQEITRVLLNLISNGFYAATQRAATAGNGFEPRLKAVTRSLGDRVEVRIRDNGTGIPPDIQEKIFNPFFTTKPAGEGTGLGLSMSHDIVVKQHGGTIEVLTEPGSFAEFIITLPRVMPTQAEAGGQRK